MKKVIALCISVAVGLVVVMGGWMYWRFYLTSTDRGGTVSPATICTTEQIVQANAMMQNGDLTGLAREASMIKGTADYQRDKNCLYIVFRQAVMVSDATAAEESLALYKRTDSNGQIPSNRFDPPVPSFDVMQEMVVQVKHRVSTQSDSLKNMAPADIPES